MGRKKNRGVDKRLRMTDEGKRGVDEMWIENKGKEAKKEGLNGQNGTWRGKKGTGCKRWNVG